YYQSKLGYQVLQLFVVYIFFFFSSRRRHTRWPRDWSSDVCSSDLQAWGQLGSSSGQRTEQLMVGMLLEQSLDARSIRDELLLQGLQQPRQALSQHALGGRDRCSSTELVGSSEDFQPLSRPLGSPQFMSMKEFFPFALARCHQRRRSGENQHKGPASRFGPVIKGFQSRRI